MIGSGLNGMVGQVDKSSLFAEIVSRDTESSRQIAVSTNNMTPSRAKNSMMVSMPKYPTVGALSTNLYGQRTGSLNNSPASDSRLKVSQ